MLKQDHSEVQQKIEPEALQEKEMEQNQQAPAAQEDSTVKKEQETKGQRLLSAVRDMGAKLKNMASNEYQEFQHLSEQMDQEDIRSEMKELWPEAEDLLLIPGRRKDARHRRTFWGCIAYLTPIGMIFSIVPATREKLVRFHVVQSLLVWMIFIAGILLLGTTMSGLSPDGVGDWTRLLISMLYFIFTIGLVLAVGYGITGALADTPNPIPIIGTFALLISGAAQKPVDMDEIENVERADTGEPEENSRDV